MLRAARTYGIDLPDPQLCCAPVSSPEGRRYMGAMYAAANFAFGNRQVITHWVRQSLEEVFRKGPRDLGVGVVYDVCHNIAKMETHQVEGRERTLCVHRKGATRAFPPGHPQTPAAYREVGQPVLIPGDMGRCSFVLVGTQQAAEETFGSTCHGAGRRLSRTAAKKLARGRSIVREMEERGVVVRAEGYATLAEEMPEAYKNVSEVVDVVHRAGISRRVAKLVPIGVIKG
jgi:tRNA-splicing ligase RtcB